MPEKTADKAADKAAAAGASPAAGAAEPRPAAAAAAAAGAGAAGAGGGGGAAGSATSSGSGASAGGVSAAAAFETAVPANAVSRPRWGHIEFVWRVESFWELRALASIQALDEPTGDVLWSERFGDPTHGFWRLKLYPFGDTTPGGKSRVSLFLAYDYSVSRASSVYAIFSCAVLDRHGDKLDGTGRSYTRQKFYEGNASWGWTQFIKTDAHNLSEALVNDTMTLKCTVDVFLGAHAPGGAARVGPAPPPSLRDDLATFLAARRGGDLEIAVQDRVFRANKTVLAARSRFFERVLFPPAAAEEAEETGEGAPPAPGRPAVALESMGKRALKLTGVRADCFQHILVFLETDSCILLVAQPPPKLGLLLELFLASASLEIPSLHAHCVANLMQRVVDRTSAEVIHAAATRCNAPALQALAENFLETATPALTGEELLAVLTASGSGPPASPKAGAGATP